MIPINLEKYEPIEFGSSDGVSTIAAWVSRAKKPKAIVQIIHGASEYSNRYFEFADQLLGKGFAVLSHDHIGHGKTAPGLSALGNMPSGVGSYALVSDCDRLRRIAAGRFGEGVPYLMLGHSMGSFILRNYIPSYGKGLKGAVVCGTGQPSVLFSRLGGLLAQSIAKFKGDAYLSPLVTRLAVSSYKSEYRNEAEWLSVRQENVEAFLADEYCGSQFSVGAYKALSDLAIGMEDIKRARSIDRDLPLLIVSGSEDSLGENGKGVIRAVEMYKKCGLRNVEFRLYEGMRHEILNETGRERVFSDIIEWMERAIGFAPYSTNA